MDCNSPYDELTVPGTIIVSPNHPGSYDNNMDCRIIIKFEQGEKVLLQFLAFDVESHSGCGYDYLEIRDGGESNSNVIGSKLCGGNISNPIISTGNTMYLRFKTDADVTRSGFKIKAEIGKIYDNNFKNLSTLNE